MGITGVAATKRDEMYPIELAAPHIVYAVTPHGVACNVALFLAVSLCGQTTISNLGWDYVSEAIPLPDRATRVAW